MKNALWLLRFLCLGILLGGSLGVWVASGFALYFGPLLPQVNSVSDMKLQTPLRIYSSDYQLIGEFGETRRQPVDYDNIPPLFIKAVLAAEDDRFFHHHGVDVTGLLRAAAELLQSGHIHSGGSTITMQVARNFFLSAEQSFTRKFSEILLSIQLERSLTKQQIFELYANKIYLGNHAYGVQAAAYVYYGKSLQELSIAEWAMLAGLPKAPSKYNPLANPARALIRRNWILSRMQTLGFISDAEYKTAVNEPVNASYHGLQVDVEAPFVAEMARQFAIEKLGPAAYTEGYRVYTTINSQLQMTAQQAVWQGAVNYDARHGYRGPEKHLDPPDDPRDGNAWQSLIAEMNRIGNLEPAIVVMASDKKLRAIPRSGPPIELAWSPAVANSLRAYKDEDRLGGTPVSFTAIFKPGDIIRLYSDAQKNWHIGQIPKVEASLVALNPDNGAVIALAGGTDFNHSKFNRVMQAQRQPGSNFKPFIYTKALEEGYTPATLINDTPIVFEEPGMQEAWRPENSDGEYLGPIRLRRALYESRNMVSIRILQDLGVQKAIASLGRFGFDTTTFEPNLSLALGSHAVTPISLVTAYAVLANGGYHVNAFWVTRIEDSQGNVVYENHPVTVCHDCPAGTEGAAEQVIDDQTAYLIDDILKDVIRKGTGRPALALNRPDIAGKTGTTNGPTDVWFSGYNRDVVATSWLGFDENTQLGRKEFGGTAALPIWMDFMREALRDKPPAERPMPTGLTTVRIDPTTGLRASPGQPDAIFEIFRDNQLPAEASSDNSATSPADAGAPGTPGATPAPAPTAAEDLF